MSVNCLSNTVHSSGLGCVVSLYILPLLSRVSVSPIALCTMAWHWDWNSCKTDWFDLKCGNLGDTYSLLWTWISLVWFQSEKWEKDGVTIWKGEVIALLVCLFNNVVIVTTEQKMLDPKGASNAGCVLASCIVRNRHLFLIMIVRYVYLLTNMPARRNYICWFPIFTSRTDEK